MAIAATALVMFVLPVTVSLQEDAGQVVLQVQDNGRGIAAADAYKGGTFGLLGMRERVAALGGECELSGGPGRGSIVLVPMPV